MVVTQPSTTPITPGRPGATSNDVVIRLTDVIRIFREGEVETIALRGLDLEIPRGAYVAVMGRSGSGKSTLLQLLGGSDRPTGGRVVVDGVDLSHADEATRATIRGTRVGVVFQSQNLPDFLTLEEGVVLACALAGRPITAAAARSVLDGVGLGDRAHHRPRELSGGEQQRAAVATVLATRPTILLADEVTGELDSKNAEAVLDLLDAAHAERDLTIIVATHDPNVAARADRTVELRDGRIVADRPRGTIA
jgi:putative ABC transport system ATP-binding protein